MCDQALIDNPGGRINPPWLCYARDFACETPVFKLNEVAKNHFLMPLDSDPAFLIMNKTSWDRLKGRGHFAANRPGNPVAITGIQEMANVPRKIASNAGNTDTAT